jgi:hypothetical protein
MADTRNEESLSRPPFLRRCWQRLLRATIGYGYKPSRALWWIGAFILTGTVLFWLGFRDGAMARTSELERPSAPAQTGQPCDKYPSWCVPLYSIDMFVPLVDLHQAKYWLPDTKCGSLVNLGIVKTKSGDLLRIYMWLHIGAGWLLTTLFVVALSGLVKD